MPCNRRGKIRLHRLSERRSMLMAANCRFRPASQGITTAAANKIPTPTRLRCASRYPGKFKTEVSTTSPANVKSKTPAIRAARASSTVNRKTPEHDGCRKQLDEAVSSESEESGAMRTPSPPERNDSLYSHPGDRENLELKNAPRDSRQLA
jgi:hypothetical protein